MAALAVSLTFAAAGPKAARKTAAKRLATIGGVATPGPEGGGRQGGGADLDPALNS